MSDAPNLRRSVGVLSGSGLAARAVGAVAGIVTARALGPADRGTLAMLLVVGAAGGTLVTAGLDLWAARAPAHPGGVAAARSLLQRHQLLLAPPLALAALVAVALGARPALAVATALLVWATGAQLLRLGLLQGADRMRSYAFASLAATASYAAAAVVLAIVDRASVVSLVTAAATSALVTACWPVPARRGAPAAAHLDALRFGLPTMGGGLVTIALYRADVLLVGLWASTAEAGRYSVAIAVAEVLAILPTSAAQAIVPRASASTDEVDLPRLSRLLVAVMAGLAVVVVAVGWLAIPFVYGSAFEAARGALPGLAAASVAVGLWKVFAFHRVAVGDPVTRLRSGVVGFLVMVVVDAVTIPAWGAVGASFGALAGYAAAAALAMAVARRAGALAWRDLLLARPGDLGLGHRVASSDGVRS